MTTAARLLADLNRLRRGWGVYAALNTRLGPDLAQACGITAEDDEHRRRDKLIERITHVATRLPDEMELTALVGLCIHSELRLPVLEGRLDRLADQLDRSRLLTQLLFTKLKVDEQGAIADDELNEPFDSIVLAGRTYEAAQRQAEEPADKLEEQPPGEGRSEGSDRPEDDTGFGTAMWQSLAVVAGQEGETTNGTSRTGGAIETVGESPDGLSPTPLLDLVPCGHSGSSKGVVVRERGLEPPQPCGHYHLKVARLPIPPLAPIGSSCYFTVFEAKTQALRRRKW